MDDHEPSISNLELYPSFKANKDSNPSDQFNKGMIFLELNEDVMISTDYWTIILNPNLEQFTKFVSSYDVSMYRLKNFYNGFQHNTTANITQFTNISPTLNNLNQKFQIYMNVLRNIKFLSGQLIQLPQLKTPTVKSKLTQRRSLIDVGGDILNKLFGVSTEQEITEVHDAILKLHKQDKYMIKVAQDQVTIINKTEQNMQEQELRMTQLAVALHNLTTAVVRAQAQETIDLDMLNHQQAQYAAIQQTLATYEQNIDLMLIELFEYKFAYHAALQGTLSPYFIQPKNLLAILKKGETSLNTKQTFPFPLNMDSVAKYYSISEVHVSNIKGMMRLLVRIPLTGENKIFKLYKPEILPTPLINDQFGIYIDVQHHLAVTPNLKFHIDLSTTELMACKKSRYVTICKPENAIHTSTNPSCNFALFTGQTEVAHTLCPRVISKFTPKIIRLPVYNHWLYALSAPLTFKPSCPKQQNKMLPITVVGNGILNLTADCSAESDLFILTPQTSGMSSTVISTPRYYAPPIDTILTPIEETLLSHSDINGTLSIDKILNKPSIPHGFTIPLTQLLSDLEGAKKNTEVPLFVHQTHHSIIFSIVAVIIVGLIICLICKICKECSILNCLQFSNCCRFFNGNMNRNASVTLPNLNTTPAELPSFTIPTATNPSVRYSARDTHGQPTQVVQLLAPPLKTHRVTTSTSQRSTSSTSSSTPQQSTSTTPKPKGKTDTKRTEK